jgi:hypothetical protein
MLVTVKAREFQRGMLAEMQKDQAAASKHFLAAAHLELVLADDYRSVSDEEMVVRSLISAASCFWRGGQPAQADRVFDDIRQNFPNEAGTIGELRDELARDYPAQAS